MFRYLIDVNIYLYSQFNWHESASQGLIMPVKALMLKGR